MGSWGITALESDGGLDAVGAIRELAADGTMDLKEVLSVLKQEEWYAPPAKQGQIHSGIEALAELMLKYREGAAEDLDHPHEEVKFSSVSSFAAEKDDLQWIREYLSDTLCSAIEKTEKAEVTWGGWFREPDWNAWRERMRMLIDTMDTLLSLPGDPIELQNAQPAETEEMGGMEMR